MDTLRKITTAAACLLILSAGLPLLAQNTPRSGSSSSRSTTLRTTSSGAKTTTTGSSQSGRASVDRRETTVQNSNVTNKGLTTVRSTTSTTARQSSGTTRQSSGTTRQSSGNTQTAQQGSSNVNRNQGQTGNTTVVRSNQNVTTQTQSTGRTERNDTYTDRGGNFRYGGAGNMDIKGDGRDVQRTPPMDRHPIPYPAPAVFNSKKPHYYGYNIASMPHGYVVKKYWGRDYYYYNGIWYTKGVQYYRVCRPPYETTVTFGLCKKGLTSVRFSYYNAVERTYAAINQNNAIIAEQNRIIAQNNAIIAAQNARLALNSTNAASAYLLATQLGLVQSFASATTPYYYQDGVFYTGSGREFRTIIPPAGAIIASLPEDYILFQHGTDRYYRVEDTLYRQLVVDGAPYFEVLGQFPF